MIINIEDRILISYLDKYIDRVELDSLFDSVIEYNIRFIDGIKSVLNDLVIYDLEDEYLRPYFSQEYFYSNFSQDVWNSFNKDIDFNFKNINVLDDYFNYNPKEYFIKFSKLQSKIKHKILGLLILRDKKGTQSSGRISDYSFNQSFVSYIKENSELKSFREYIESEPIQEKSINQKSIILYVSDVSNTENKDIVIQSKVKLNKNFILNFYRETYNQIKDKKFSELQEIYPNKSFNKIKKYIFSLYVVYSELYNYLNNNDEYFNINYTQSENGRYYCFLTNLSSEIREVIFNGYIEYDVNNFAPSFLYQYYKLKNYRKDEELPIVKQYIEDKKSFRTLLAKELSNKDNPSPEDIKLAKIVLVSLFFGARIKTNISSNNINWLKDINAIAYKIKSHNPKYWDNFTSSNLINELKEEMKILFNYIGSDLEKNNYTNKILSVNGRDIEMPKFSQSTAVAHFYQSFESMKWLTPKIKKIKGSTTYLKNVFLIHDGIYSLDELDIKMLEKVPKIQRKKINIEIGIEKI